MKNIKKLFVILAVAMIMFSLVLATINVVSAKNEYNNGIFKICFKEKTINSKVTWSYNGGLIGKKTKTVTNIKKGKEIKKFPQTPFQKGYTFSGWYTKKTGGKKISTNTKPIKSVTYYAQWKKNSKILTSEEKKIVGKWSTQILDRDYITGNYYYKTYDYNFKNDGTFKYNNYRGGWSKTGNYKVSSGKITFTNVVKNDNLGKIGGYPTLVAEFQIVKQDGKEKLKIPQLNYYTNDYKNYLYLDQGNYFKKV